MQIRRLLPGDEAIGIRVVEEVKFVEDGIVGVPADLDALRTFLADERCALIAALDGDAPVGMVLGYELPRIDGPRPMMFLYEIGVLEPYRRRGIGKALMDALEQHCQARDCRKMFVPTSATNAPAMALYASAGGRGGAAPDSAMFEWRW